MATGYTHGIIDGTINTFEEFATKCVRAFGAAVHMRDESLSTPYKPQKAPTYNLDRAKEIDKEISKFDNTTDESFYKERIKELDVNIKYYINSMVTKEKLKITLQAMLDKAVAWNPPTNDHIHFKEFMVEQLESTIKWDCDIDYDSGQLERYSVELDSIKKDPTAYALKARIQKKESLLEDSARAWESHYKEAAQVSDNNKWVKVLLKSL